jgi:predicted aspartyl protease
MPTGRPGRALVGALLALVVVAWAGCVTQVGSVPAKTTLAADRVALPTKAIPGISCLFVEAKINGQGPFRLVVDTGAHGLALAPRVAAAAGLKPFAGGTITVIGAAGKTRVGHVAVVDRFEAGGFAVERFWAYLMNAEDAENFRSMGEMDGLCGLDVFADVVLEIDFPRKQVDVVRRGTARYPAVAGVSHERAVVSLELGDKPMRATIDTGFDGTFDLPLDEVALRYPRTKRGGQTMTIGGVSDWESSQLEGEIRLGPLTWSNPPVTHGLGLIGSRALQTWKVVVDQHDRKIYFIGSNLHRRWPQQVVRATAAGYLADYEGTTLKIRAVIPNTAAAQAGLKAGDAILTINGAPAASFVTGNAPELDRVNRTRRMRVRRDGQELELTMDLPVPPARP